MKNLNEWIAEKIMGECAHDLTVNRDDDFKNHWQCSKCDMGKDKPAGPRHLYMVKSYTTDLNLAFEAAEKAGIERVTVWLPERHVSVTQKRPIDFAELQHKNSATAIALAIYKLKTGKDWVDKDE
jgi:hypothetical protein